MEIFNLVLGSSAVVAFALACSEVKISRDQYIEILKRNAKIHTQFEPGMTAEYRLTNTYPSGCIEVLHLKKSIMKLDKKNNYLEYTSSKVNQSCREGQKTPLHESMEWKSIASNNINSGKFDQFLLKGDIIIMAGKGYQVVNDTKQPSFFSVLKSESSNRKLQLLRRDVVKDESFTLRTVSSID